MGSFRFYRRVHISPGLTVNVSKSGPSLSVGVRGAHVTIGRRGIRRTSVSLAREFTIHRRPGITPESIPRTARPALTTPRLDGLWRR